MPTWSWIVIVVVAVVIVLLAVVVVAAMMRQKRSERLREQFGPEYEHAVETAGGQRAAERELLARERKHNKLKINELTPESRARYIEAWGGDPGRVYRQPVEVGQRGGPPGDRGDA